MGKLLICTGFHVLHALIGGGNWNNGAHCGARAVNCNNYPWNVNANIGVWCVCDLGLYRLRGLRATSKDLLVSSKSDGFPVLGHTRTN